MEKFKQEWCDMCSTKHTIEAELVPPFRPDLPIISYMWRCPRCRRGWVTVGSPMDVYNETMHARQLLEDCLEED